MKTVRGKLFRNFGPAACLSVICFLFGAVRFARADNLDDFVTAQMNTHQIPGLSLAIIDDGKIVRTQCYGFADKIAKTPVTSSTLFQAGSISKPVAALGALRLVEQGVLSLDEDVNVKLQSWKVPENNFTKDRKVTLRDILSHSAGFTVHGFPGYALDAQWPTLVQVLDGVAPANTAPVRVDFVAGSQWRYSGGGFTVMQQLIIDVTGQPFAEFMQQSVLNPIGMTNSSFAQPPSAKTAAVAATGYKPDGTAVPGKYHIYPEMAAAGLWTTPSDLARLVISIQESLAGKSNPVISPAMTRLMLTAQKDVDGLGVFIKGSGKTLQFFHNGRDAGFDAYMKAFAETGQGAIIMINANEDSGILPKILGAIAKQYHWPDVP